MSQRGWRRRGGGERSGSGAAHARRDEALLRLLELALLRLQLLAQVDALLLVPPQAASQRTVRATDPALVPAAVRAQLAQCRFCEANHCWHRKLGITSYY